MTIRFWKMSGAGNDFIVLSFAPEELPGEPASFVRRICRRGLSVGADGVLFVTPGSSSADVVLVHYNADGGRSEFCGNGSRCAARFAVLTGIARSPLLLATDCGTLRAEVSGDSVRIEIPPTSPPAQVTLVAQGAEHRGWFVRAGVPHFVLLVADPGAIDAPRLGAALRSHPDLAPEGANIDFVGPVESGRARLRTFERGVEAETLACGSGAIAAAAVLASRGIGSPIVLTPSSGIELTVEFDPAPGSLRRFRLTGEARVVFEGQLAGEEDTRLLGEESPLCGETLSSRGDGSPSGEGENGGSGA